ncbi:PHA/PHB synthase family protein [Maliponia aquimaris]|uniref:Poly-beta-hydroxybutyrate polymerase n=1 Tax=Maliponia aquimaris TaxID=1673631 RepID=A0A238L1A1_9RHOB|nr:alpha/beta fold hydrolase [Maliponia aquimaris]SMX48874.1 Poly-beta-hydroxybutyrate polymerase [Maliponia aquimaris]
MDRTSKDPVVALHMGRGGNASGKAATRRGAGQTPPPANDTSGQGMKAPASPRAEPIAPASQAEPCPDAASTVYDTLDHAMHASIARYSHGLSPAALMGAWFDWAMHIAAAPGKRLQLAEKAADKARRHARFVAHCAGSAEKQSPCIEPLPQDDRFRGDAWQAMPFNVIYQGFLLQQQWWHNAVTGVPGVTAEHERQLQFLTRQLLDTVSPSNFLPTNPEVLQKTRDEAGMNLVRGAQNFLQDLQATANNAPPADTADFQPGRNVAVTPGKVVYRNRLIELIQYAPLTKTVRPEPILIVPAWIMKYYILDLSPQNSLVKYLVGQGYTVFMISWKNPGAGDRDLTMEDYRQLGVMAALDAIKTIVPDRKIHAAGYCLGGTLLAIAAAEIARGVDEPFASLSLLASQVDFTEPGEMQLFINESQLSFLDSVMWKQGFLDTTQMAGAFQMLRSNDLIWSRAIRNYLMGERRPMNDLMAWNADGTRMPHAMHSEYLRKLYLDNDLAEGRFDIDGRPVALSDIRAPIFAVGTMKDHVAPWPSVFKIQALTDTDVTFALTSGGHNAGIVSEPGRPRRFYRVRTKAAADRHVDPQTWVAETEAKDGSWWEAWLAWLDARSGASAAPPDTGNPQGGYPVLGDAPGTYVFQK